MRKEREPYCPDEHPIIESLKDAAMVFCVMMGSVIALAMLVLFVSCSTAKKTSSDYNDHTVAHYEAESLRRYNSSEDVLRYIKGNDSVMHKYNARIVWYDTNAQKDPVTGMHPIAAAADISGDISSGSSSDESVSVSMGCEEVEMEEEVTDEDSETHEEVKGSKKSGGMMECALGLVFLAFIICLFLAFIRKITSVSFWKLF